MKNNIVNTDKPAGDFLKQADADYLATRLLFDCGSGLHGLAAYHSQQCLEKYLKTYTVQEGNSFIKTHDLDLLRNLAADYNNYFSQEDVKKQLAMFNVYDQVTRYGAEASYDPFYHKDKNVEIAGLWFFSGGHIKALDKLAYEIRTFFDFNKIKFADTLKAILEDRKDNIFTLAWNLPIPIKKVLTVNNDYFK